MANRNPPTPFWCAGGTLHGVLDPRGSVPLYLKCKQSEVVLTPPPAAGLGDIRSARVALANASIHIYRGSHRCKKSAPFAARTRDGSSAGSQSVR